MLTARKAINFMEDLRDEIGDINDALVGLRSHPKKTDAGMSFILILRLCGGYNRMLLNNFAS